MKKAHVYFMCAGLMVLIISSLHCNRNHKSGMNENSEAVFPGNIELPLIGKIKPRHAHEIESNAWNIACGALDREYTIYDHYREYMGPLGAKSARIAGGWFKIERAKGVYDFAWIESIVDDLISQGMEAWFRFGYGNPIYEGGGGYNLGAGFPHSPEALTAWDNYVRATVLHFRDRVSYWEIWNEPNGGGGRVDNPPSKYGELFIRTAEIIRELQPDSRITGLSTAGIPLQYIRGFLDHLQSQNKLHLIDEVSFHSKPVIPDAKYTNVEKLQALVAEYSQQIVVIMGENGCPSVDTTKTRGALRQYNWTERSQAKWYLRDMLGDYARGIPHSVFTIIDIHYPDDFHHKPMAGVLNKGLLKSTPDQKVDYPKQSYYAVQNAITIFDDTFERINDISYSIQPVADNPEALKKMEEKDPLILYAFRKKNTPQSLFMVWFGAERPAHEFPVIPLEITYTGSEIIDPVYVDLLSGNIYDIQKTQWKKGSDSHIFQKIPIYDSPVLIAGRTIVRKQMLPLLWWKKSH